MTPTSNILFKILSFSMLMTVANLAFAGDIGEPGVLPEPGTLELLAIGAVGAVLYGLKSRKKD